MFIHLPDAVAHAITLLNGTGYEAFAVGGCVRDSLLGKIPTDWDITTSATPDEMKAVFADYRTIETGLKHGTLTVLMENTPLEITTYRIDGDYSDGRHPDAVMFTRSLAEDLCRRDFTINAMAYHPDIGLIDYYDGQADLECGVIRCVGNPNRRFAEDALRILRALRFASVLGFSIDGDTASALSALAPTLSLVASERIWVELTKLLCGQDAAVIVEEYSQVLRGVIPELKRPVDTEQLSVTPNTPCARLVALFSAFEVSVDTAESILRRLRADSHTIDCVKKLLQYRGLPMNSDADLLHLLNRFDEELIFDYLALNGATGFTIDRTRQLLQEHACYKVSMLSINGSDVIRLGFPVGPMIGSVLNELLAAVMDGRCQNSVEDLLCYAKMLKKPVQ